MSAACVNGIYTGGSNCKPPVQIHVFTQAVEIGEPPV